MLRLDKIEVVLYFEVEKFIQLDNELFVFRLVLAHFSDLLLHSI